ncbi:MAG: hypothetical protein M1840_006742 [Geoglossum simile]|nr:MAG: hypothetical protein M1840_006742 [Geoglossum simile]
MTPERTSEDGDGLAELLNLPRGDADSGDVEGGPDERSPLSMTSDDTQSHAVVLVNSEVSNIFPSYKGLSKSVSSSEAGSSQKMRNLRSTETLRKLALAVRELGCGMFQR